MELLLALLISVLLVAGSYVLTARLSGDRTLALIVAIIVAIVLFFSGRGVLGV